MGPQEKKPGTTQATPLLVVKSRSEREDKCGLVCERQAPVSKLKCEVVDSNFDLPTGKADKTVEKITIHSMRRTALTS